ncbi:sigma-54 interaction domain-containing protein [Chitinimonas lacunae]|uniref:Sigma-54 interaction domain-containing protein n=1 Tax=Chitinimonas lacunae TaxID=1963018 RepID=A0ABV8MM61_9NEIS
MFESIHYETVPPTGHSPTRSPPYLIPDRHLRPPAEPPRKFGLLHGNSPALLEVFRLIERVAPSDVSVMIIGESGCGKELVARTIHEQSACAEQPFVAINCGALPANLIESELFGYEKGAFTGAIRTHQGFFERAQGGTLFLDEITEMPLDLQVRLLRVLETGQLVRVGGDREIACDVRVLAATNRDPLEAVRSGMLRQDLLYRLAVFPIVLPPLRERGDDVVLLAQHFLEERNRKHNTCKTFAPGIEDKLRRHHWPGNVRELKNCIHRAYILAEDQLDIDTPTPLQTESRSGFGKMMQFEVGTTLEEVERRLIFATLDCCQGNKRRAAEILGVSLKTIYNRLNGYDASKPGEADNLGLPSEACYPS